MTIPQEEVIDDAEVSEAPSPSGPVDEQSEIALVKEQLALLMADVKHLAKTELEYVKLRAAYSGGVAKKVGLFGAISVAFGFCAVIGLVCGLLLIVDAYLGPIAATVIVTGLFVGIALAAALLAKSHAKKWSFKDENDDG